MENKDKELNPKLKEFDDAIFKQVQEIRKNHNEQEANELINNLMEKSMDERSTLQQSIEIEENAKNTQYMENEEYEQRMSEYNQHLENRRIKNPTIDSQNLDNSIPNNDSIEEIDPVSDFQDELHPFQINGYRMSEKTVYVTKEEYDRIMNPENNIQSIPERNNTGEIDSISDIQNDLGMGENPINETNIDFDQVINPENNNIRPNNIEAPYTNDEVSYYDLARTKKYNEGEKEISIPLQNELKKEIEPSPVEIITHYLDDYDKYKDGPKKQIHEVLNNLQPDKDLLNKEINKIQKKNELELKEIRSPEVYSNLAKEMMNCLKNDIHIQLIKDIDEEFTANIPQTYLKDEFKILLSSSNDTSTTGKEINRVRKMLLGKETVSKEEYIHTLTKLAEINQLKATCNFDPKNKASVDAFNELNQAHNYAIHILFQRQIPMEILLGLNPNNPQEIDSIANGFSQLENYNKSQEFLKKNPVNEQILQRTNEKLAIIFDIGTEEQLSEEQKLQYTYAHHRERITNTEIKIDLKEDVLKEAEKIMKGQNLNLKNMRESFHLLYNLEHQYQVSEIWDFSNTNNKFLKETINQTKDFLISKGISSSDLEYLTSLSWPEPDAENKEFDKRAESILLKKEYENTAKIPVSNALDKFYTDLAITFDAANNKYGADLTTDVFVSAAKTFRKMCDMQKALFEMKSSSLDELSRNVAKIEKFLELKGFSKEEIKAIKEPNIYKEDKKGLDGFQRLAEHHWDVHEEKEITDNNALEANKTDTLVNSNEPRQQIKVDLGEKKVTINDKEPFDISEKDIQKSRSKEYDEEEYYDEDEYYDEEEYVEDSNYYPYYGY